MLPPCFSIIVAVFLNGLSCAGARKAWDAIRLQPIAHMKNVRSS
jgi:hypothetical protein